MDLLDGRLVHLPGHQVVVLDGLLVEVLVDGARVAALVGQALRDGARVEAPVGQALQDGAREVARDGLDLERDLAREEDTAAERDGHQEVSYQLGC